MDSLNKVLENVMSLVPKKHKKLVNEDNLITLIFFLTAIYIYQKKPEALVGFLVHPFSQVILLGSSFYFLNNKKYNIAIGISFIFITSILINKENIVDNLDKKPIETREFFEDKTENKDEDEDEDEEEEFEDDDEDEEEEFEDDEDDEEEEEDDEEEEE